MNPIKERLLEYEEDFKLLGDDNAIVEYIIELGKDNEALPSEDKNDDTLVKECSSKAWLISECKDNKLYIKAEGESALAKGMIAFLLDLYSGRDVDDILEFDPKELYSVGLDRLLSPVRQQGLEAFLGYLYRFAKECKEGKNG